MCLYVLIHGEYSRPIEFDFMEKKVEAEASMPSLPLPATSSTTTETPSLTEGEKGVSTAAPVEDPTPAEDDCGDAKNGHHGESGGTRLLLDETVVNEVRSAMKDMTIDMDTAPSWMKMDDKDFLAHVMKSLDKKPASLSS